MSRAIRALLVAMLAIGLAATGCGRSIPLTDDDVLVIRLTPEQPSMYIEQQLQLRVEAFFADGRVEDVTYDPDLLMRLSDTGVVRLLQGGRLIADHAGRVRLEAFFGGKQDSTWVEVRYAQLEGISVEPESARLKVGETLQLYVSGQLDDSSKIDLTGGANGTTYHSDRSEVAAVTADGLVFALARGTAEIAIEHAEYSALATIQVSDELAELVGIELQPSEASLLVGGSLQLYVLGRYDDGSTSNLTRDSDTLYSNLDEAVATVDEDGLVEALAVGETVITAVHRQFSAQSRIGVTEESELVGVEVEPSSASLSIGAELQLTVRAVYRDGSRVRVTELASYESSAPGVASVSAAGLVRALAGGQADLRASYGGYSDVCHVDVDDRVLVDLFITNGDLLLELGQVAQLQVMGRFSDGSLEDLSAYATGTRYTNSNESAVSIGPDGLLRALGQGLATIRASNAGLSDSIQVEVHGPELVALDLVPERLFLGIGETATLTLWARYSDGASAVVTPQAEFTTSNPNVARLLGPGQVSGVADGRAVITARFGGLSDTCEVTVQGAQIVAFWIEPSTLSLTVAEEAQLHAWASYSDGTQAELTAQCGFSSSDDGVAAVSAGGLVTGVGGGSAAITATFGTWTAACQVRVESGPELIGIDIQPDQLSLQVGSWGQLTVLALYSDGSFVEVTDSVSWQVDDPAVARVYGGGQVQALQAGTARITARFAGFEDTSTVEVRGPDLVSVEVLPPSAILDPGEPLQLVVLAHYSDGSSIDVTPQAAYVSDAPGVASVSPGGLVIAQAAGQTAIHASFGGRSASCLVEVRGPELLFIDVVPSNATLDVDDQLQLEVRAYYSDGSSPFVTGSASWVSDAPGVASVSPGGLVTARASGHAVVTASFQGLPDTCAIDVELQLVSLRVEPDFVSIEVGNGFQLTVTAVYSDGSESDVTTQADYVSDDPDVASVDAGGQVYTHGPGHTVITASYGGLEGTCHVEVTAPVLVSVELTPESAQIFVGGSMQFTLLAIYSDGSSVDVTEATMGSFFESSDTGVLGIAQGGFAWGVAAGGPVTVTGSFNGLSDTASVTVLDEHPVPVLTDIDPDQIQVGAGSRSLIATGSGFDAWSVVRLDGGDLVTTYMSATRLQADLPGWLADEVGIHEIRVYNPPPGGGTSGALQLYVIDTPVIFNLSPSSGLQGRTVRVAFYGQGLLACEVATDNPGIAVSNISYAPDGSQLFATFVIAIDAPPVVSTVTLSNAAGFDNAAFTVIEDQPFEDLIIAPYDEVWLSGVQAYRKITVSTGAIVHGQGPEPLQLLATDEIVVRGTIEVSGLRGEDGYFDPAAGGDAGAGGGGGGGGGDGNASWPSPGGAGAPPGEDSRATQGGAGTPSGSGGGTGAGSGISGGCGQGGGGGGFGGNGGGGGGDTGVGTGGAGGAANIFGSDYNGGTGGGGGSTCGSNCGGGGGGGGGVLVIASTGGSILIGGALRTDGGGGGDGYNGTGGGGGGSGGRITVTSAGYPITIEDTLSARGGTGGRADAGDGGGGGGGGRIVVDAGGGGIDDSLGIYDLRPGAGGISRADGYNGQNGTVGVVNTQD
ncbi:MAG: Ig-like domain-containing protein [Deltaproteobacteria bacterium]|nr:Ig-like domain-containing protein [Deltaproteobacteria bacterium]